MKTPSGRSLLPRALPALVLFLAGASLAAAPLEVPSRITAVTVYEDGAIVTREAEVEVPAGTPVLQFAGLPESLNPNLLQISAAGTARATILDVHAATERLTAPVNPRLRELQEQQRALAAELRANADAQALLAQQRDYLERIKALNTTQPGGPPPPAADAAEWDKRIAFYTERQTRLAADLRVAERTRAELTERAEILAKEIDALDAPAKRTVQNVWVRFEVGTAGRLKVRLAYPVEEAGWKPNYDVRVSSSDNSITLGHGAMVRQSTGEDWTGIELNLSTAQPAVGGKPPVFEPWNVGMYQPKRPVPGDTASRDGGTLQYAPAAELAGVAGNFASGASTPKKADAVEVESSAGTTSASVSEGLGSAVFRIPYAANLPSDNAARRFAVGTANLTGVINRLSLPKLEPYTYIRARVTNTAAFPFTAGDVSIYLDGSFVAASSLPDVPADGKFVLHLGTDEGITVKRKVVKHLTENTGAFAKRARVTHEFVFVVENHRKTEETLILKDQVPVSSHEKIVVNLLVPAAVIRSEDDAGQDGAVRRDTDGTVSWTLKLKPGEKREVPFKFTIEHPTDFPVEGLR